MSKFVLIQAIPSPGFDFHGEAHRLWPAGGPVKVEVLDQEDDPPEVPTKRKRGDQEVVEMAPNPHVIGRRSFRAIKANTRLRILSDGESVGEAQVAAVTAELQQLKAELIASKGREQNLETDNDQLRAQVQELQKALGQKATPLAKKPEDGGGAGGTEGDGAPAPGGEKPPAPPAAPAAPAKDPKDKGKGKDK